jgi:hypothetical protein
MMKPICLWRRGRELCTPKDWIHGLMVFDFVARFQDVLGNQAVVVIALAD